MANLVLGFELCFPYQQPAHLNCIRESHSIDCHFLSLTYAQNDEYPEFNEKVAVLYLIICVFKERVTRNA